MSHEKKVFPDVTITQTLTRLRSYTGEDIPVVEKDNLGIIW